MSSNYRCTVPLSLSADVAGEADVYTEIDVLEIGKHHQAHGAGDFEVTAEMAAQMVRNHAAESARGYEPPLVLGHEAGTGAPAVGWVESLAVVGTRVKAKVRLLSEFARKVKSGEFRYLSPEFAFSWVNQAKKRVGAQLMRVAVTNVPHQRGLTDGGPAPMFALTAIAPSADAGTESSMTDDKAAPAGNESEGQIATLTANLSTLTAKLASVEASLSAMETRATAAEKELAEKTAKLAAHEAEADLAAVKAVVSKAESDGRLTPAMRDKLLPGFSDDPRKSINESAWKGNLVALSQCLESLPIVAPTGARLSVDAPPDAADVNFTDNDIKRIGLAIGKPSLTRAEFLASIPDSGKE